MKRRSFMEVGVKGSIFAGLMQTVGKAAEIKGGETDKWGKIMPTRPLGKTGQQITILGVGGAHLARMKDDQAEKHVDLAIENGVRFFDTAHFYYKGRSERLLGKYLVPKYRDQVFLMTKTLSKTAKDAEKQVHESLQRMKTDHVDMLLVHTFFSPEDVDNREKNGVFDKVLEIKKKGLAKNVGVSCHTDVATSLRFFEKFKKYDFLNTFMTPINPVDAADPDNSFTRDILPKSVELGISHFAMKTMGGGTL